MLRLSPSVRAKEMVWSMVRITALALVALVASTTLGDATGVNFVGKVAVHETTKPPTMIIRLNRGERSALTRADGSFVVHNLEDGAYALEVQTTLWTFPSYTISVKEGRIKVISTDSHGRKRDLPAPFRLGPYAKPLYFEARKTMNIWAMLLNPQMMMMGFMVIMVFVMPKMMNSEEMKKIQEEQRKQGGGGAKNDQEELMKMLPAFLGGKGGATGGDESDSD